MKVLHVFTKKSVCICLFAAFAVMIVFLVGRPKHIVVCAGDSLTYGSGVGKHRNTDSYPAQLQSLLGGDYTVVNCGLRNATASFEGDLPYVESEEYKKSLNDKAEIVILMLGANDTKTYNWSPENYKAGLESLVESYIGLKSSPYVVLGRPPYTFSEDGSDIARYDIQPVVGRDEVGVIVDEVAKEYGIQIIDLYEVTEGKEELYTDGIHFNKDGYELIRDTIYTGLVDKFSDK